MANYWRERELKNIEANIRKDRRTVKELRKQYKQALDDIEDDIERFYGRYATREGISMEEAQKRVSKADISKYEAKAKRYVKERNFSPKANREMRIYNVKMQMSRLELLKKEIELELLALVSEEERLHYARYHEQIIDEFKRQAGILGETINYNSKTVEALIYASYHNATWSINLWSNQNALRAELDKLIHRSLVQGKNPREMARELRKVFESSVYNSERLLRTETGRAQIQVQQHSYNDLGIEYYEVVTERDACDICKPFDGKRYKVKDMAVSINAPLFHPNCKCSTAAHVPREG